ncbi:MAG: serine hydrolase domain-containing protein [Brevundimonas sp.]|uniref:serine hydrolase domain-containing protein n=1 Tax=Brevundimonas sp. TaxID=1871086 RepID=UPI0026266C41|nr:serine hydrolase domain-containing protein [Brevundimonas sp.]MDI6625565.1 serine hydrolase domain-containing protein [Brevundimonas sp.]MDQ7811905.1 serine hydrolase domain-containing protein [Brevundimonas sp.]
MSVRRLLPPSVCAGVLALALASPVLADPVDDIVRDYMEAAHIPGAAVAVIQDGRVVKLEGYGQANLEWEAPVTADTPFQTASASKVIAGLVLMRLVEQGTLSLDAPVSTFFQAAPETWRAITVRHLAGHTSGLAEARGLPNTATPAEVAAEAMKLPLAYPTGTESRYGLTDFVVMTAIMEKASGLSYPDLVRREIVEPLGLTHTGFIMMRETGPVRAAEIMPGRARVYGWRGGVQRDEEFIYPVHVYAAGGLYSSARDLAVLMAALEGGRLLTPESFALLTSPATLNDGRDGSFGVGWTFDRYNGLATVGHTGGPALADVMHVPSEKLTVIALTNQRRFYPLLSHAIADLSLPAPPEASAIADARPELTAGLRRMLEAAVAGQVDPAAFADNARDGAVGFYQDFGQAMLVAVGPLQAVDLMDERAGEPGELRRRYRVRFERRTLDFVVRTDAAGLFSEVRPLSGDDL